jgi:hypothetical protein
LITADGRFDLDLLAYVQHPAEFEMETGEIIPNVHPGCGGEEAKKKHAQNYFRLYNHTDGIYRTLLFAKVYADLVKRLNGKCQTRVRATTTVTYSLLGLYTCRSYQDKMWDEVHEVISSGKIPDFKFV